MITINITALSLSLAVALVCLAIAMTIADVHPLHATIEYCRFQFGRDRSPTWAKGELTGEQKPVVVHGGRHRPDNASGTLTQRREGDTMAIPRITDELAEVAGR